jgi:hypothetical protein
LQQKIAKVFHEYDRGVITESECVIRFVSILTTMTDPESISLICKLLPGWFQQSFHKFLSEIEKSNYYYTWTGLEDPRSDQQRDQDSLLHQAALKQFAPSIRASLRQTLR